jgi:hypothetical protein
MAAVSPVLMCAVMAALEIALLLARSVNECSVKTIKETTSVCSETVFRTEDFNTKRIL